MLHFLLPLIQGTLECTGMIALSTILCRVPQSWKQSIILGVILSLVMYFVKQVNIFYGLHTVIGFLLIFVYLIARLKAPVLKAFLFLVISYILLAAFELLSYLFYGLFKINIEALSLNPISWALSGIPQALLIILTAIVLAKFIKQF